MLSIRDVNLCIERGYFQIGLAIKSEPLPLPSYVKFTLLVLFTPKGKFICSTNLLRFVGSALAFEVVGAGKLSLVAKKLLFLSTHCAVLGLDVFRHSTEQIRQTTHQRRSTLSGLHIPSLRSSLTQRRPRSLLGSALKSFNVFVQRIALLGEEVAINSVGFICFSLLSKPLFEFEFRRTLNLHSSGIVFTDSGDRNATDAIGSIAIQTL